MNLSNLLSGLIGAVIGGIFSFAGSYWTMKQQRSQTRLGASHSASSAILDNIATIKNGMYRARKALKSRETPSFDTVHAAAERIVFVYNVLIADKELRTRISQLISLVKVWYENALLPSRVNEETEYEIYSYMDYVRNSIIAHLDEKDLPGKEPVPDLGLESEPKPESTVLLSIR